MSIQAIRGALQTRLLTVSPALLTSWENKQFDPPGIDTPYQEVTTVFATPVHDEISRSYRQPGVFQVRLGYPLNDGAAAATARAELIRTAFPRGASLQQDGVTTHIQGAASIGPGLPLGARFWLPVRIRFEAWINVA